MSATEAMPLESSANLVEDKAGNLSAQATPERAMSEAKPVVVEEQNLQQDAEGPSAKETASKTEPIESNSVLQEQQPEQLVGDKRAAEANEKSEVVTSPSKKCKKQASESPAEAINQESDGRESTMKVQEIGIKQIPAHSDAAAKDLGDSVSNAQACDPTNSEPNEAPEHGVNEFKTD